MSNKKTTEPKEIQDLLDSIDMDGFLGQEENHYDISMVSFIEKMNDLLDSYLSRGYSNVVFQVNSHTDDYYGIIETKFDIYGTRMETEAEFQARLERNRKAKETRERNKKKKNSLKCDPEYQEYKRLKKKFDGGV